MLNTVPGVVRSAQSLGQVHPETFPQPACCVACTSPWLFQLPPKQQDEFERIRWSPLQPSPKATARVIPVDELNGSTVDLLKTAMNLLSPGVFRVIVDFVIKTPDQRVDQCGTSLSRQGQRVSQKFCCIPSHDSILPPAPGTPASQFIDEIPPDRRAYLRESIFKLIDRR
jgi:hypothetical protein